ncbi:MAG TPA: hypothetical protein PKW35_02605 [Nannocystaceae bacterium]|nr:hypothetical protein [Nannocystaceae bacterium]
MANLCPAERLHRSTRELHVNIIIAPNAHAPTALEREHGAGSRMSRRYRWFRCGRPALLAVISLLVAWLVVSNRQPGHQIHQTFQGPMNAPIIIHISADQRAEVEAKVGR